MKVWSNYDPKLNDFVETRVAGALGQIHGTLTGIPMEGLIQPDSIAAIAYALSLQEFSQAIEKTWVNSRIS